MLNVGIRTKRKDAIFHMKHNQKRFRRVVAALLVVCCLCGLSSAALALDAGESRVVIGANLTESDRSTVYSTFGIQPGSVPELTVTNAEERTYLEGNVDSSVIGSKSISCVYIETLDEGSGLDISCSNISWCTKEMYINALVTAGINDAKVIVTAPYSVSGTAALTGVYKAYEDITGTQLDETAKLTGTQELVVTAELADTVGNMDAVTIVNELKSILDQTRDMTDEELREQILQIAEDNNVTLSDSEINSLISLCRSLEKLSFADLKSRVEQAQNMIAGLSKASGVANKLGTGLKSFFTAVTNFFSGLFGKK